MPRVQVEEDAPAVVMSAAKRSKWQDFLVAHDESGNVRTDMFFAAGLVVVPRAAVGPIASKLDEYRRVDDYWGEIHFRKLRNLPGRLYGERTALARRWVQGLPELAELGLRSYVFLVNREADGFDGKQMPAPRHLAYNRYTRMGVESALRWFFSEADNLQLRMISDAKHRVIAGGDGEFNEGDNFTEYLPRAVRWRVNGESDGWPTVRFSPSEVELVDTSAEVGSLESELLQLTDVLTSAIRASVSGGCSTKPAKRLIVNEASTIVSDLAQKPWRQRLGLHRRFGLAEYQGNGFADPVVSRVSPQNQQALPFEGT